MRFGNYEEYLPSYSIGERIFDKIGPGYVSPMEREFS